MNNNFEEIISDLRIKYNFELYPKQIYYYKYDVCYFRHDLRNNMFYINFERIWQGLNLASKYSKTFYFEYNIKKYFKLINCCPIPLREDKLIEPFK